MTKLKLHVGKDQGEGLTCTKKNAYINTLKGNAIYFIGADDPTRIKGLKDSRFNIAIAWGDEVNQFKSEEEVDSIKNSIIRGKLDNAKYKMIYSYNPPKRKGNWCNRKFESKIIPKHYFVHSSSYLTNSFVNSLELINAQLL